MNTKQFYQKRHLSKSTLNDQKTRADTNNWGALMSDRSCIIVNCLEQKVV
jgi:hypothetical protein